MRTADKIGLLPGFGWIADHSWWRTLLITWAIAPFGVWFVQLVFEWRPISLKREDNYLSFFPGDLFLGMMLTGLLLLARYLPAEHRWYNSTLTHVVALGFTVSVAIFMTWLDAHGGGYTWREIFQPAKLYHNLVLYGPYAYLILVTLLAVCAGSAWSAKLVMLLTLCLLPGVVWVALVAVDSSFSQAVSNSTPAPAKTPPATPR
ncbi:MAG: hypothetical protein ACQR33_00590 [Candidatus Saccharibacteria bacterium]